MTMIDQRTLYADLQQAGLGEWIGVLDETLPERLNDKAHGKFAEWRGIVDALPAAVAPKVSLDTGVVVVRDESMSTSATAKIQDLLMRLSPWRKGPFRLHGVHIDSEWQSNLKWNRLADAIEPLRGRRVLDVGSGNGYYALRMLGAGARLVIGIDPTLLFVCQFAAVRKLSGVRRVHVLPLRLEDLPDSVQAFETTFSMGVLYHRRDPHEHLALLRDTLQSGGQLVLETLVLPGEGPGCIEPADRYARMRNVWHLPTMTTLLEWLDQASFNDVRVIDVTPTTVDEQRATAWMPYESLRDALDPNDAGLTIEGLPAPTRAIVLCRAP